jgi:acylphosphatase
VSREPPHLHLDSGERRRLHATVHGRVRGTGFRAYCVRHARLLGLSGEVRYAGGAGVEVVAEGDAAALDAFVDSLRRGNRISEVRDVDLEWSAPRGDATGFVVGD